MLKPYQLISKYNSDCQWQSELGGLGGLGVEEKKPRRDRGDKLDLEKKSLLVARRDIELYPYPNLYKHLNYLLINTLHFYKLAEVSQSKIKLGIFVNGIVNSNTFEQMTLL